MDDLEIKKSYTTAAIAAAGIIGAIVLYTVVVELLCRFGHRPPLVPPAAYAVKYALYAVAVSSVFVIRAVSARLGGGNSPEETLRNLRGLAIVKAALSELPAVSGLVLFILTGSRADFYMLVVFAIGLEIYHFPRLSRWEEVLRR